VRITATKLTRAVRRPRLTPAGLVWLYVAALSALALAAFLGLAHGRAAIATPEVPWWGVALGFLVAEACVVHLQFQRSAHSFSLADIPFVFALVFASGDSFVLGALVGTAIVFVVRRLALGLLKQHPSTASVACKRLTAGLDTAFLEEVLLAGGNSEKE